MPPVEFEPAKSVIDFKLIFYVSILFWTCWQLKQKRHLLHLATSSQGKIL